MKNFIKHGFDQKLNFFNVKSCSRLKKEVLKSRNFNKIWLTEKEYKTNKVIKTLNPRTGRNLLEKLNTEFIFSNEKFINLVNNLLGSKWKVLDHKFVVAINTHLIPAWIKKITNNTSIPNLGRFVKEKFRDLTYFSGIDFHQDIIDYPHKKSDFITFYIYLDEVEKNSSPLILLPKSHLYGAKTFPHNLRIFKKNRIKYFLNNNKFKYLDVKTLIGKTGSLYFWHPCMLHGTQPTNENNFRISIRILIEKNQINKNFTIDKVNKNISKLSLITPRKDLYKNGSYRKYGNIINNTLYG